MTPDHDAIDELLAGYVLQALSGPDAADADRLLAEHVPERSGERTRVGRGNEDSVLSVENDFRSSTGSRRDDRLTGHHRLDH